MDLPDLAALSRTGDEILWVALSPWAMATLDKNKIAYTIPDDYVDRRWALDLQACGLRLYRQVLAVLRHGLGERLYPDIDGGLWEQDWWELRFLHDGMLIRLAEMLAVLDTIQPDRVVYVGDRLAQAEGYDPDRILFYETILGKLSTGRKMECQYLVCTVTRHEPVLRPFLSRIKTLARGLYRTGVHRMKAVGRRQKHACEAVLALDRGYNWTTVVPILEQRGMRVVDWVRPLSGHWGSAPLKSEQVSSLLEATAEAWAPIEYGGVPLLPLMKDSLVRYIGHRYPVQRAICLNVRRTVKREGIRAVCASIAHTLETTTAKWAARQEGVPTVCWYHGGYSGYIVQDNLPFMDGDVDCLLTFGPGASDYVTSLGCRAEPVTIGATMFPTRSAQSARSHSIRARARDRKVVALTLTNFSNQHRILVPSVRSDVRMWRHVARLLDVLSRHRDRYFLVVKRHPDRATQPPIDEVMEGLFQPGDVAVVFRETRFDELLDSVDAVIHLIPSTTLLQSLLGHMPVACYITPDTLTAQASTSLRKRVLAEDDEALYCERLDACLRSGGAFADPMNREFRDAYARTVLPESAADQVQAVLSRVSVQRNIHARRP